MRRFFALVVFIFLLYASWPIVGKHIQDTEFYAAFENIKSKLDHLKEDSDVDQAFETISVQFNELINQAKDQFSLSEEQTEFFKLDKPKLNTPTDQSFSILNIELGDTREEVEKLTGEAKRVTLNEYDTNWYAYHENYQNFVMVSYDDNNKVVGLYTNQDLISSTNGIKYGDAKDIVLDKLGDPLTKIRKGFVYYQFPEERDFETYQLDGSIITLFFDKHQENTLTSLKIISEKLEQNKTDFYTKGSKELSEGFEFQLFDLTNATRVNHELNILAWDDHVRVTAKKHSKDMAENNYFDHTNLNGQSPFDRMAEDEISFTMAGENLASGQFSSIFAHEGLMNSLGHRKNIIKRDFRFLGVGVAFNDQSHPYYTEKFFTR